MPSDAQKRADRKYKREKTRQVCLRFYPADSAMWAYLGTQDNRQGFIKGLIQREMDSRPNGEDETLAIDGQTSVCEDIAGDADARRMS